jgi:hypothetical protein
LRWFFRGWNLGDQNDNHYWLIGLVRRAPPGQTSRAETIFDSEISERATA